MKLAITSDSHDHVPHILKFVRYCKEHEIATVLHAGDYCSPFAVLPFEGLKLIGVFGNNDGDHYRIIQKFDEIGGDLHNEFHDGDYNEKNIALYHGTQPGITKALVRSGTYDLVISGHTHTPVLKQTGPTLHLNPGSLHGFDAVATFAIYDTETEKAEIVEL